MLLPVPTPYVSSEVSALDELVRTGEQRVLTELPHQLHIFLVQCLLEHMHDPDIVQQVLAISFLEASEKQGAEGQVQLKRVGDGALILVGFFPERALRLNVGSTYFRSMGEMAYSSLGVRLLAMGKTEQGKFFDSVASNFELLRKVLQGANTCPKTDWGAYRSFRASLN